MSIKSNGIRLYETKYNIDAFKCVRLVLEKTLVSGCQIWWDINRLWKTIPSISKQQALTEGRSVLSINGCPLSLACTSNVYIYIDTHKTYTVSLFKNEESISYNNELYVFTINGMDHAIIGSKLFVKMPIDQTWDIDTVKFNLSKNSVTICISELGQVTSMIFQ